MSHALTVTVMAIGQHSATLGYFTDSIGFEREYTDADFPKPIPLTPEWLERAGFEKKVDGFISTKWHIGINPVTQDYLFDVTWLSNFDRPFYRNGHFKIDYVHQLQNLYFALTGTELEFK